MGGVVKRYFYSLLSKYISVYIRPDDTILEINPPNSLLINKYPNGHVLNRQSITHSSLDTNTTTDITQPIDYILLNGTVHFERDIQTLLSGIHKRCNNKTRVIFIYYVYYTPYVVFLCLPMATLMATIFSIGNLARKNEIVALKALGYSIYKILWTLLFVGFCVSLFAFILAEGVVTRTTRKKENIRREYLKKGRIASRLRNIEIQEPPNQIITIGYYDVAKQIAHRVKIETFNENQLISRIDSPRMAYDGNVWHLRRGYKREFDGEREAAIAIRDSLQFQFQFTPDDLMMAQITPDEMNISELIHFIQRIRLLGGEVHVWLTDIHLRVAFPLSNLIIVLFSLPMAYGRRKKSLAIGFGISLAACFFYFGLVKLGQTIGHKGGLHPFISAWLGNGVMGFCGMLSILMTRK